MVNLFTHLAAQDALAAHVDVFDVDFPDWQEREAFGTRFLSERDFPVAEVANDDWDFFLEVSYVDPAEREW